MAVNALLQLLVIDRKELETCCFKSKHLESSLPSCVSVHIFRALYKDFLRCVLDAILTLPDMKQQDIEPKMKIAKILWCNLIKHMDNSSEDVRVQ